MNTKFTVLLFCLCLCLAKIRAQTPNDHYILHDSSPDSASVYGYVSCAALTADGGTIVLTGNEYRGSVSATTYGFSLIRYDAGGSKLWNTFIYGDASNQNNYRRIIEMTDGGFAIIANSNFGGAGTVIKTDASGNFLFMKTFTDGILDAQLDSSDNGLLLTTNDGNTYSGIIKTDASGNTVWSDTREFVPDPDHYYTAKRLSNGNYLAVGVAYSNPSISIGNGIVACYNSAGTLLWSKTYSVSTQWITEFENFTELSDGNILIGGATSQLNVNGRMPLLTKLDQNGNVLWSKSYGTASANEFYTTYSFSDDFAYIGGCLWGNSIGTLPVVAKLDSSGNMIWARMYPQPGFNANFGPSINFGPGTYNSAGESSVKGNHYVMYNSSAFCNSDTSLIQSCYSNDTSFVRTSITMTSNVITPAATTPISTPGTDTRTNSAMLNYSKLDECIPAGIENSALNQEISVSVYPNPFTASANVYIHSPVSQDELMIFDIYGNEVKSYKIESGMLTINREGLAGGVYFIRLLSKGVTISTEKIIVTE